MKNYLAATCTLVLVALSVLSFGQTGIPQGQEPYPTFAEEQHYRRMPFDSLLSTMSEQELADSIKAYKHYKVWQNHWRKRVADDGNILDYQKGLQEAFEAKSYVDDIGDWHELGPNKFPDDQLLSNIGGGAPGGRPD